CEEGTKASLAARPGGAPGAMRSRGICTWLVVSELGLKKRKWRAVGRNAESSAKQRKICLISSTDKPEGTSNMICERIGLARGLYPGSGTRQVHISQRVRPSAYMSSSGLAPPERRRSGAM